MSALARFALSASVALALLVFVVSGCSRTPPEPEPAPRASAPDTRAAEGTSTKAMPTVHEERCITPLGSAPPRIPAPAPASACPKEPFPSQLPLADVAFPDAPGRPRVTVELVRAPADVERGLMFRREMAEDRGMLFTLDGRREHTFWMRNTCIPLDMIFVDEDGTIVGIVEAAEPLTETTRSVGCPSRFVIEVNAGYARKHGVAPGQRAGLPAAAR